MMLKSRVHWRAGLRSLAKAVVECAGTGVCTSDYARWIQECAAADLPARCDLKVRASERRCG